MPEHENMSLCKIETAPRADFAWGRDYLLNLHNKPGWVAEWFIAAACEAARACLNTPARVRIPLHPLVMLTNWLHCLQRSVPTVPEWGVGRPVSRLRRGQREPPPCRPCRGFPDFSLSRRNLLFSYCVEAPIFLYSYT